MCSNVWFIVCAAVYWGWLMLLEIFCSWYVHLMVMWEGFWIWEGQFPWLILVDGKNPEDFLLCRGHSFSVVPESSLGTTLQAGDETYYSRGYLEDWEWSRCSSSECHWMQILKSNLEEMQFVRMVSMPSKKEEAFPSCWLNCCAKEASSVTWRVAVSCLSCNTDHIPHFSCH